MNRLLSTLLVVLVAGQLVLATEKLAADPLLDELNQLESHIEEFKDQVKTNEEEKEKRSEGDDRLGAIEENLKMVTRQMMLQQFAAEESTRSNGYSGIKQTRTDRGGLKSYFSSSVTGRSMMRIHDHANNIRTVGMGEFIAIMNGVEFRTRHNDYRLKQAHSTDTKIHATEDIPFPDVPEAVLNAGDVDAQIEEMRKWFKAWKDSDDSVRDYKKHFKPVMCYLEGAWMRSSGANQKIDEP